MRVDNPRFHEKGSMHRITKGWSLDEKYLLTMGEAQFLLRTSTKKTLAQQEEEYQWISAIPVEKGIGKPLQYGLYDQEKTYILYQYLKGEDFLSVLPSLTQELQYDLGLQAGDLLSKIHQVEGKRKEEDALAYGRRIARKIKKFHEYGLEDPALVQAMDYVHKHKHLIKDRPKVLHHGDFHVGNMIVHEQKLFVVDFNRYDFGDPYEEFDRITLNSDYSSDFTRGLLHGYFKGVPPLSFWHLLKIYRYVNAIGSIPWALEYSLESLPFVEDMVKKTLEDYEDLESPLPKWYQEHLSL